MIQRTIVIRTVPVRVQVQRTVRVTVTVKRVR